MEGHGRLITPRRGGAVALVAVILGATVAGWWVTRRADEHALAARARAVAAPTAAAITARIDADAESLGSLAAAAGGDLSAVAGAGRLLGDPKSPGGGLAIQVARPDTDLRTTPAWGQALATARDDGAPRVAAGPGSAGRARVLIAAPAYRGGGVPPSVAERRFQLVGYLTVVAPADVLLAGLLPAPGGAVRAQVADGPTVIDASAGSGRAPTTAGGLPISTRGVTWTVETWTGPADGVLPWATLAVGVALAITAGLIAWRASRRTEAIAREASARADELRLIARTGPPLQQSLDLGDLLPVFVVEVSEELDLDRVGISLFSEQGELVKVFSLGAPPVATIEAALGRVAPRTVAKGEDVVVPLQRGGRLVGAFNARARSGLVEARMDTLRAVCDLLAAALGNAALFEQEQDLVHRLRDLDRMKTTFLGSVSHELRTMVTAISGFANLLVPATDGNDGRQAEYIERIHRNARSLSLLIDDLLDFAALERAGLSVDPRIVDLSALVPGVVDQMSSILIGRPVELHVEPGIAAYADPAAIERILVNLLSNAAKYTPSGSPVAVGVSGQDGRALLTVSDRGPGIPVAERTRVFGLFYRGDNPSTRSARGVGIGLALVAELTSLLHGTVVIDDAPGGGARFCVSLPMSAEPAPERPAPVVGSAPVAATR